MKITAAVLAAGKSSRMGSNKLLLPYGDHTVIEEDLIRLYDANPDEIILITGFENERLEAVVKKRFGDRIRIVFNDKYELGRAESIKRAVENVSSEADAILFMVGDKPTVSSGLIRRAIEKFGSESNLILYVKTPEGRGHPIIFSRDLFQELLRLSGDKFGDDLIEEFKSDVIELDDSEAQLDINTPNDYRRLQR